MCYYAYLYGMEETNMNIIKVNPRTMKKKEDLPRHIKALQNLRKEMGYESSLSVRQTLQKLIQDHFVEKSEKNEKLKEERETRWRWQWKGQRLEELCDRIEKDGKERFFDEEMAFLHLKHYFLEDTYRVIGSEVFSEMMDEVEMNHEEPNLKEFWDAYYNKYLDGKKWKDIFWTTVQDEYND